MVGCSTHRRPVAQGPGQPPISPKALEPFDRVALPATRPSPRSATQAARAPLDAIQLFAQARAAMQSGQRFAAVQLLDQALVIDPDSYEMLMTLGKAAMGTTLGDRARPAFERAVELVPDAAEPWLQLARLSLQSGDTDQAIRYLRAAMATPDYAAGKPEAIWVDILMARTLQKGGYDTAALEVYDRLLKRLPYVSGMYRGSPEVMQVIQNPDLVLYDVAVLNTRLHRYPEAIASIEQAIIESPRAQQYATYRVRLLMQAGRPAQAREFMADVISHHGAGVELISLLREVYAPAGGDSSAIAGLRRFMQSHPDDRNVTYALAQLLAAAGDVAAAQQSLSGLLVHSDYDLDVVKRLCAFYESCGRTADAARVIIESTARHPDTLVDVAPIVSRLARISRSNHLRLTDLQEMRVDSWAEASRLYWISRLASLWDRDEMARSALEKAVRQGQPFAPAYRALLNHYWSRRDWDETRKLQASRELFMLASIQNAPALTAELRGITALNQGKFAEAADHLREAMRLGETAPEVQLGYANVKQMQGDNHEAERTLVKLTDDFPLFDDAYAALIRLYANAKQPSISSAMRTLQRWNSADPHSPSAQLYQADLFIKTGHAENAERVLLNLFDEYPDNAEVLGRLAQLYIQTGRAQEFIDLLEKKRQGRPDIRELAECLVDVYRQQHRLAEAGRVVDDLRRSAGNDADLLYYVSHLYTRLDDQRSAEAVLEQTLRADANHSSAANDLGYYLADQGRDLDRAERLIRIAVKEEPDNQAFLDSLGWVMYKRGRFAEAHQFLDQAIAQTIQPDPVVLDHLGDALYRDGKAEEAAKVWQQSAEQLDGHAELEGEYKALQVRLSAKLRLIRQNLPVETAPLAQPATTTRAVKP